MLLKINKQIDYNKKNLKQIYYYFKIILITILIYQVKYNYIILKLYNYI